MWRFFKVCEKKPTCRQFASYMFFGVALAAWVAPIAGVFAATIEALPPQKRDDAAFITIEGEIKSGDDEKFRKIAAEYSDAIVLLNSDGGKISPAMDIGRTIKLREYKTVVYKDGRCTSACALIWVAGSSRSIFEGGEVGFHASYLDADGAKLQIGVGNALVGHYLSQLGFGEKAVIFATMAPPDKILWLSAKTASLSGIEFDAIPTDEKAQAIDIAQNQPPPPPIVITTAAPMVQRRQDGRAVVSNSSDHGQFMGDAKQTIRSPEAFAQALRTKGFQAIVSYDDPKSPNMEVGVGGEKIAVSFSGCTPKGCNYIELMDYFNGISKNETNAVIEKHSKNEFYSHPIYFEGKNYLAFYNYIVIGADGITVDVLVSNMEKFVESNKSLLSIALEMRAR